MGDYTEDLGWAAECLQRLTERSNELSAVTAIDALALVEDVIATARETKAFLEQQLVKVMEQPIQTHGKVWYVTDDYVDRWDHDAIAAKVTELAIWDESDPESSARHAARMMQALYVAPSTTAKRSTIDQLGIDGVHRRENRGKKLGSKQVEEPQ